MDTAKYKELIATSPFNKSAHSTPTIDIKRFFSSISLYRDALESRSFDSESSAVLIKTMTPKFQRENTKWSREMQMSFVENVVSGFRSDIMFYYISSEDAGFCYILDGLQRMTAIGAFVNNELPIFGEYYYSDIVASAGLGRATITLKIYEFLNHKSACEHYIAMNKNITHSPEDLEVAYQFLDQK
jgi:hypothetical protein